MGDPGIVAAAGPVRQAAAGRLPWTVLLALAVALVPLWGVPRDFHDGVIAEWGLVTGRHAGLAEWLVPSNWWGHLALYRAAAFLGEWSGLPAWAWIKLWMSVVVVGLSYEAFRLAMLLGFTRRSALAAAAITACFPAWCVLYSSAVMHIGFSWAALVGHRWLFWERGWRRPAGFLLAVLSFQVNANLVFQVVLGGVAWAVQPAARRPANARLLALVAAAAVGWYAFFTLVHPPTGDYEGYNALLWPTSLRNLLKIAATAALFASWGLLLLPGLLAALAWRSRGRQSHAEPAATALRVRLAVAALLLAAAVFPYAMVGKGPPLFLAGPPIGESVIWSVYAATGEFFHITVDAFTTRQAALMAVPFALLAVALLEALTARRHAAPGAFAAGVAAILVSQSLMLGLGHFRKWEQAHWDQSLVEALRRLPPPPPGRVEIALSPVKPYLVHVFESNSLLWQSWGRTAWLGVVYYQGSRTWQERMLQRLPHHGHLLQQGPGMHEYLLMADFPAGADCVTRMAARPSTPDLAPWQRVAQWLSDAVTPARISAVETRCGETVFSGQP